MNSNSLSPKISILTPSYNQGRFIGDLISSIVQQGYSNYEHIVMDGGSTDNTLEVLRASGEKVVWESGPDGGQTDAINKAWAKCTGDIVTWINADDWFELGAFDAIVKHFAEHPEAGVVHGDWYDADIDRNHLKLHHIPRITADVLRRYCPGNVAMFFKRNVFERCMPLDVSIHLAMDLDLLLKAAMSGAVYCHSNLPLASMRRHPDQRGTVNAWGLLKEGIIIVPSKYFGKPSVKDYVFLVERWIRAQIKIRVVDPVRSLYRRRESQAT